MFVKLFIKYFSNKFISPIKTHLKPVTMTDATISAAAATAENNVAVKKVRNRKFCLLLTYCGQDYFGMQRNPGFKTIEEQLLKALLKCQLIREEHYLAPRTMLFQRSARTDKHVSAIRQIVSLKCSESIQDKLDDINNELPQDIKVTGCKRVTGGFDAKNFCEARTYTYLMPSFALRPKSQEPNKDYRLDAEQLRIFNEALDGYRGVHLFHNFTSGKNPNEPSSTRVIRFMSCSEPFFPCNQKEIEFVLVRVKGQAFMIHQIRKMIGLAIAVTKGYVAEDCIGKAMEKPFMDVPKAPGLGLMLEDTHFDGYNRKFAQNGSHEAIEWNNANAKINEFKEKFIYPVVVDAEVNKESMLEWLKVLNYHYSFDEQPSLLKQSDKRKETEEDTDTKRVKLDGDQIEKSTEIV